MRPAEWQTLQLKGGTLSYPLTGEWHTVGEYEVPSPLRLRLEQRDAPTVEVRIDIVAGVPRVVQVNITRTDEGREVRAKDLALNLGDLVEQAVALVSFRELEGVTQAVRSRPLELRRAARAIQAARGRSQRQMSPERLRRVAELYQAQETGGIDAIAEVYGVDRSTAARWVAKAREQGILPPRSKA